ncbi:MAG: hypothetical protein U1C70_10260 [Sediminibacterium sp.]|jgi:uncharacterized Fe-S cluster-containing radical SAM superfamily enzyme|uniref:hypothetical protein n=1 Tax=Sediminibacterium sp. TaxID=1917865 RepID=UPI002ABD0987|nr:hypothetical protein [Sediminibacterium sp.]MDZ4072198.1 hypothetical protein [Sediminibacterium sp.]
MAEENKLMGIDSYSWDQWVAFVNELITQDFNQLLTLLYRLDINEKKLKQTLADHPDQNAGELIAKLIIDRQEEKKKSRETFKQKDWEGSEEERW